jgi:hypothetical protein
MMFFTIASTEASHKKLLQLAEKTVGSQLNDAEIKIAEVQKVRQTPSLNPRDPVSVRFSPFHEKKCFAESPEEDEWPKIRTQGAYHGNCRLIKFKCCTQVHI